MRNYNKIALACCSAAFGLFALTGCEGGEIFEVDAPDWISDKVQEIEDENKQEEEVLEGMMEDVYSFGNTDYTSGWWTSFSKYYVIPDGQKWNAVFNLHLNPTDNTYFKNFVLIFTNDDYSVRNGDGYKEYAAIRFDYAEGKNSQWCPTGTDYMDVSYISSTLILNPTSVEDGEKDPNVQKLAGKVTVTVDRTDENAFKVKMTNGEVTKTYEQPYQWENLNSDPSNTNIRCFLTVEGSYIDFLQTNIEPIGGCTSAADKNPVSMKLLNVPTNVDAGTELKDAMAGVTAEVTFEEGVTKTVTASELSFSAIPDMTTPGEKILVAAYNKTFRGENCDTPIMASASFEVIEKIVAIEVTTQPSQTTYYYYTSEATQSLTERTFNFNPEGMVITGTDVSGARININNARLSFSTVPVSEGTHAVTISLGDDVTTTVNINVKETDVNEVNYSGIVGAEDNTTAFLGAFSDNFNVPKGVTKSIKFTNYCKEMTNYENFLVVLRKADNTEYAVLRADNYAMGNASSDCIMSGTQWVNQTWEEWCQSMDGAKVTVYVTNCGNGTADVQIEMICSDNELDTQYYLGLNAIEPNDLSFAMSVEGCHLVFGN